MENTKRLDAELENLRKRGTALPKNTARARLAAHEMHQMATTPGALKSTLERVQVHGANDATIKSIDRNTELIRAMGEQRRASKRMASTSGTDVWAAIPRFYDPLEYWDLSGLPWNMADEGHRHKLHKWLRLYYATHYLVPTLIDIFTRFPLIGMEFQIKDKQLKAFYEDVFLDQLNYQDFLVSLGREFWTIGEAFPLASFDEDLGVWEREELLNPEDIVIENFPLLGSKQLKIVPPDYLKKLATSKSPPKEYKQLEINFPELIPYLRKNEKIPISGVLLKQVANLITDWDDHGTPILLRGLRTLMHEEKLLASQDAIAERLYSPLILAKLGIMDLGDQQGPWIPTPDELEMFRDDLDIALSSDFRVIVHHFGIEMENVFGREQMPRLGEDFDRIEKRIMQIFGVNPSLLSAGSASQPYASSALQAEFLNQVLRTFQNYLKRHFRERALVVAEAQGHYDYETKGQTRVPIMEEVAVFDDDFNKTYETRHKLLVPELEFEVLDLRDEATERQFFQMLRTMGVPIPDQKLMIGINANIEDWSQEYNDELVKKTIAQQEAKLKTYKALTAANLPVPPDLKAEVETVLQQGNVPPQQTPGGLPGAPPGGGAGGPVGGPGESVVMPGPPPGLGGGMGPGGMGGPVPGGGPPPTSPMAPGPAGSVPAQSMERRPGMPRPGMPGMPQISSVSENGSHQASEEDSENVIKLPRNIIPKSDERKKKYSFVDPDVEPLNEDENDDAG